MDNDDALTTCPMCNEEHPTDVFLIHVFNEHPAFFVAMQAFITPIQPLVNEALNDQLEYLANTQGSNPNPNSYSNVPYLSATHLTSSDFVFNAPYLYPPTTEHYQSQEFMDDEYEYLQQICDYIGNVHVGVPNIEEVTRKVKAGKATAKENLKCPICIETIKKDDHVRVTNCCKNPFCCHCIETWFDQSKRCPLCNLDVVDYMASISKLESDSDIPALLRLD